MEALPWILRPLYAWFVQWFRWQYENSIGRMDHILVNSENVRQRLKHYTGLEAEVVHPPVATKKFQLLGDERFYLFMARLVPNKRVDLIVRAFAGMPEILLLVLSGGPELERLKALAAGAKNILFTGWQTDEQVSGYESGIGI